jgi:hypothetical protein
MPTRINEAYNHFKRSRLIGAFTWVLVVTMFLYRIILVLAVALAESPPLGTPRTLASLWSIWSAFGFDLLFIIAVHGLIFLVLFIRSPKYTDRRRAGMLKLTLLSVLLLWHAVLTGSHINLLFTMNIGFTWSMFVESMTILTPRDFFALFGVREYATLIFPLILFLAVVRTDRVLLSMRRWRWLPIGATILITTGLISGTKAVPDALRINPHVFLLRDALRSLSTPIPESATKAGRGSDVYLNDPLFASSDRGRHKRSLRSRTMANVIFIVLESTASEYIFDTRKYAGGKMPMPYLASLRSRSLYARQHFASNNSSPRSLFTIFSGLYESPQTRFFAMEKNVRIPHLIDYLGKGYESLLVTPADINWYFPRAWFRNRGFNRLQDYHALKEIPEYKAGPTSVRDEFKTVDYFLSAMRESTKPYLGIYYTFVGHWPYPDLAEEHKIVPAISSRNRYINNLYAQDQVIEKIITDLERTGKIDNTIVVIVGDHGEAFYQHPGNRVHSGESYNENIASPLLIYAPKLIAAKTLDVPTTHADIVPTLLDALGVEYDPYKLQGESLLTGRLARRFIFTYGNENTLTAVDQNLSKMQILRGAKGCRTFDLSRDPEELRNLACQTGSDQYQAIQTFFSVQPGILKSYNQLCNDSGC